MQRVGGKTFIVDLYKVMNGGETALDEAPLTVEESPTGNEGIAGHTWQFDTTSRLSRYPGKRWPALCILDVRSSAAFKGRQTTRRAS